MNKNKQNINQLIFNKIFDLYRCFKKDLYLQSDILNLTMIQMHALFFIKHNPKSQLTDLAKTFKITLPTATTLTEKLVKLNLIKRVTDKSDRRVIHFYLTKKGAAIFKQIDNKKNNIICGFLNRLNIEEKGQLLKILNKIFD